MRWKERKNKKTKKTTTKWMRRSTLIPFICLVGKKVAWFHRSIHTTILTFENCHSLVLLRPLYHRRRDGRVCADSQAMQMYLCERTKMVCVSNCRKHNIFLLVFFFFYRIGGGNGRVLRAQIFVHIALPIQPKITIVFKCSSVLLNVRAYRSFRLFVRSFAKTQFENQKFNFRCYFGFCFAVFLF